MDYLIFFHPSQTLVTLAHLSQIQCTVPIPIIMWSYFDNYVYIYSILVCSCFRLRCELAWEPEGGWVRRGGEGGVGLRECRIQLQFGQLGTQQQQHGEGERAEGWICRWKRELRKRRGSGGQEAGAEDDDKGEAVGNAQVGVHGYPEADQAHPGTTGQGHWTQHESHPGEMLRT